MEPPPITPATPPPSSSVHLPETAVSSELHFPFTQPTLTDQRPIPCFHHNGWRHARREIYEAMIRLWLPPARIGAFAHCRSDWWVLRDKHDDTHFKVVLAACHDRWCIPCQRQRAATIRRNLHRHLHNRRYRFLTLTLKHTARPLAEQIDKLFRSFKALRKTGLWRDRVDGGAAFFELKLSKTDGLWHPHLHVVLDGLYIPQYHLACHWLQLTGDSNIVDIRPAGDTARVLRYVTKYVMKAYTPAIVRNADRLDEAITALNARRTLITFGTWRRWRLLEQPHDGDWEVYDTLISLVRWPNNGGTHRQDVLAAVRDNWHTNQLDFHVNARPPPTENVPDNDTPPQE